MSCLHTIFAIINMFSSYLMVSFLFFSDLVIVWSIHLLHSLLWSFSQMTVFKQRRCHCKWQEHKSINIKKYKRDVCWSSALVMIMGFPPSMVVVAEFMVPKSVPTTFLQSVKYAIEDRIHSQTRHCFDSHD